MLQELRFLAPGMVLIDPGNNGDELPITGERRISEPSTFSHPEMDAWNTRFYFWNPIFEGYVKVSGRVREAH